MNDKKKREVDSHYSLSPLSIHYHPWASPIPRTQNFFDMKGKQAVRSIYFLGIFIWNNSDADFIWPFRGNKLKRKREFGLEGRQSRGANIACRCLSIQLSKIESKSSSRRAHEHNCCWSWGCTSKLNDESEKWHHRAQRILYVKRDLGDEYRGLIILFFFVLQSDFQCNVTLSYCSAICCIRFTIFPYSKEFYYSSQKLL